MATFGIKSKERLATCRTDIQKVMNEAFVYCWTNSISNNKYVGYHLGNVDDGQGASSRSDRFWHDYNLGLLKRDIVHVGSKEDCFELEQFILLEADLKSDRWYNNGRGGVVFFTDEIRKKISDAGKKRDFKSEVSRNNKISDFRKTCKLSEATKTKIGLAHKGKVVSQHVKDAQAKRMAGAGNPRATKVMCNTTKEVFELMSDAASKYNMSLSMMSQIISGRRKHKDGYTFTKIKGAQYAVIQ